MLHGYHKHCSPRLLTVRTWILYASTARNYLLAMMILQQLPAALVLAISEVQLAN